METWAFCPACSRWFYSPRGAVAGDRTSSCPVCITAAPVRFCPENVVLPPRVLLVEDHALMAPALRWTLEAEGIVVGSPPDLAPKTILAAARDGDWHLVVLDLDLDLGGHVDPATSLIGPLAAAGSRVVALTSLVTPDLPSVDELRGVSAVVSKADSVANLLDRVWQAATPGSPTPRREPEGAGRPWRSHRRPSMPSRT